MNVMIIGGAGYIGSHVNKLLNKLGHTTIILDNLSRGFKELVRWGKFVEGDFADSNLLDLIFSENKIDVVMHFSAFAYVGESLSHPSEYYINNVNKTIQLLGSMVKHNVNYFIFSSSCATFGKAEYLPIDEKHPQDPINPYGRTKLIIEHVLKDYEKAYDLHHCILRYFNAAGADPDTEIGEMHNPETHLIPLVFDAVIGKLPAISIFGNDYDTEDGTCIRDYLHVNDIARAHILSMEWLLKHNSSNFFNLGSETGYSVLDVIHEVEKITRKKVPYQIKPRRDGDPAALISSSNKAHITLNWHPEYDTLKNIIATAWEWYQKQATKG